MTLSIVHVIDSLSPGGAERVMVELINGLEKFDVDVRACVTRTDTQYANLLRPETELVVLNRTKTWDIPAILRFSNYCRRTKVDVLHAHGRSSVLFCALIKLLNFNRIKLIFHDHFGEIANDRSASLILRLTNRVFVDFYIGVDTLLMDWAITILGMSASKTAVLTNCIDTRSFRARLLAANGQDSLPKNKRFSAAMVANLRPQKDHPLLIKALANADRAREQLHVLFVGSQADEVYTNHCKQLIADYRLYENFSFLGPRDDVPEILASVDFGLLSSRSESGPLVLLEYLSAGLPFLATLTGGIALQLRDFGHGIFSPPNDPECFAEKLDELVSLTDTEKVEIGARGQQLVDDKFNLSNQIKELIEIYSRVIGEIITT